MANEMIGITRRALGAGVVLFLASGVYGDTFCDGLTGLGDGLNVRVQSVDQNFALPDYRSFQAGCKTSLGLQGGKSLHCMWTFPYRADTAAQAFDTLQSKVRACGAVERAQDQNVNHPDFYDLRIFSFGTETVGISLKDKAMLSQTLVFLTFSKITKP
jgi:hypothetical protein